MEAQNIESALQAVKEIIAARLKVFLNKENAEILPEQFQFIEPPPVLTAEEQFIIMMALAPHVHPNFFETIIQEYLPQGGEFPEFGAGHVLQQTRLQHHAGARTSRLWRQGEKLEWRLFLGLFQQ